MKWRANSLLTGAGVGTSEKRNAPPRVLRSAKVKGAYMAIKKLFKNGRDIGTHGGMSQIKTEMQESAAFKTLAASSIRVLLYAFFLNYFAATHNTGRPVFKFTNRTARETLGMNQDTFTRAKQELADKGFWEWKKRGGLRGCNGIASEFALSGDWKTWEPPKRDKRQVRSTGQVAVRPA